MMIDATRRGLFGLAAAAGGGALLASRAGAAPARAVLETPGDWLRAYMQMRGALDDRLVIGFISGRYYGVVDNAIQPLYGVVGATFSRYRLRADGRYEGLTRELPYFTDLATGAVIDTYRNPYTNEDVAVVHGGYPAARIVIGDDLRLGIADAVPGLTVENQVVGRDISGGDVWLTEQTRTTMQLPGLPKPIHYSEVVTNHARLSDLADPSAKTVACQNGYTSVVSWRPWLKMGDRPGHLTGIGHGGYNVALADLPKGWRDAVAIRQPKLLSDPESFLPAW